MREPDPKDVPARKGLVARLLRPLARLTAMKRRGARADHRQGVVLPETPRDRRNLAGLEADVQDLPLKGRRLGMRLRNFSADASSYLASLGGRGRTWRGCASRAPHRRARGGARRRPFSSWGRRGYVARGRRGLGLQRGERPDRLPQPLGIRRSRGCRWIRGRATTCSSTDGATVTGHSTCRGAPRFPSRAA